MKYDLVLLVRDGDKPTSAEVLLTTDSDGVLAELRRTLPVMIARNGAKVASPVNPTPSKRGAKGRQVIIRSVEEGTGTSLEPNMVFDSALEVSNILGVQYNIVSYELKKAKAKGETSTVIRGVEVEYVEDIRVD